MVAGIAKLATVMVTVLATASCASAAEPTTNPADPASLTQFTPDTLEPVIGSCGVTDDGFNYFGVTISGRYDTLVLMSLPYPDDMPQNRLRAIEDTDVSCVLEALGAPQSALAGLAAVRGGGGSRAFEWDQYSATIQVGSTDHDVVETVITLH
jgi:hypothetical protein